MAHRNPLAMKRLGRIKAKALPVATEFSGATRQLRRSQGLEDKKPETNKNFTMGGFSKHEDSLTQRVTEILNG